MFDFLTANQQICVHVTAYLYVLEGFLLLGQHRWAAVVVKKKQNPTAESCIAVLMSHTANPVIFLAKTDFSHLHPIISCFREAALTTCIGSWLLTCCLATWMLATGTKSSFLLKLPELFCLFFLLIPDNSVASKQQGLSKKCCFILCLLQPSWRRQERFAALYKNRNHSREEIEFVPC